MKKKGSNSMESEENVKVVKPAKKESAKNEENAPKLPENIAPLSERINSVSTAASLSDKSNNSSLEKPEDLHRGNENGYQVPAPHHEDHQQVRSLMEHEDMHHDNRQVKLFDNYYPNYSNNFLHEPMGGEYHEFSNNMHYPSEFDLFTDTISAFKRKLSIDDFFHDPNGFLGNKEFNTPHATEDKQFKFDNTMHHNDNYGENANCPLKSFMDTQNLLRQALRKGSFASNNGSYTGYRRGSFDWMRKSSFDMF